MWLKSPQVAKNFWLESSQQILSVLVGRIEKKNSNQNGMKEVEKKTVHTLGAKLILAKSTSSFTLLGFSPFLYGIRNCGTSGCICQPVTCWYQNCPLFSMCLATWPLSDSLLPSPRQLAWLSLIFSLVNTEGLGFCDACSLLQVQQQCRIPGLIFFQSFLGWKKNL